MFYGREFELSTLEETYNKPGFQMTIIYGRRRIGKSKLITHFLKNKRGSYYTAIEASLEINVKSERPEKSPAPPPQFPTTAVI